MKKILLMLLAMVLCFSMAACGGIGDSEGGDSGAAVAEEKDDAMENATLSKEKYEELCDSDWGAMSPEEMEQFLGVKYVVDEESTESWGEGYLVVDFPGPDDESRLHVLFKTDESGKMSTSSLSATGQLLSD